MHHQQESINACLVVTREKFNSQLRTLAVNCDTLVVNRTSMR